MLLLSIPPVIGAVFLGTSVAQFYKAIESLRKDPFRAEEYEEKWRGERFKSIGDFVNYYFGYIGRQVAYGHLDNLDNWG